jgi:hypothetical protein
MLKTRGKKKMPPSRNPVTIEVDGVTIAGSFELDGGLITVFYKDKQDKTQLGRQSAFPEAVAQMMLVHLAKSQS